jgi:RNase adaptor protein for sRNA GlmZ degradation
MEGISNSSFNLIHYAIKLARYYMHSGRETSLKEILRDVRKHPNPHYIEELKNIDEIEREAQARSGSHRE